MGLTHHSDLRKRVSHRKDVKWTLCGMILNKNWIQSFVLFQQLIFNTNYWIYYIFLLLIQFHNNPGFQERLQFLNLAQVWSKLCVWYWLSFLNSNMKFPIISVLKSKLLKTFRLETPFLNPLKYLQIKYSLDLDKNIIFRPHILKWGRKIMICDAFFSPNFAKSPQSPHFDYLNILYSY